MLFYLATCKLFIMKLKISDKDDVPNSYTKYHYIFERLYELLCISYCLWKVIYCNEWNL